MTCRFCKEDVESVMLIPDSPDEVEIRESPFACIPCGKKEGIWCEEHDTVHLGFENGHACTRCIERTADVLMSHVKVIIGKMRARLSAERYGDIEEWARFSSIITGRSFDRTLMIVLSTVLHVLSSSLDIIDRKKLDEEILYKKLDVVLKALPQDPH